MGSHSLQLACNNDVLPHFCPPWAEVGILTYASFDNESKIREFLCHSDASSDDEPKFLCHSDERA